MRGWQNGIPSAVLRKPQRTCLFVAVSSALALLVVDLGWWFPGTEPSSVAGEPAYWALCGLGWLLNALVLDRHLRTSNPSVATIRRWIAVARFCLAGVPVAGLLTVPAWQWLAQARFRWIATDGAGRKASQTKGIDVVPRGHRLTVGLLGRGATWPRAGSAGFLLVLLLNLGLFALWIPLSLPRGGPSVSLGSWIVPIALSVLWHLAGTGAALGVLALEARSLGLSGGIARLLTAPALLWLVPIPGAALLGVVSFVVLDAVPRLRLRELTLVHRAFAEPGSLLFAEPWRRLHRELGQHASDVPWIQLLGLQLGELERQREVGRAERGFVRLRRVTLALLPFEAALAIGWWTATGGSSSTIIERCLVDSVRNLGIGALLGAALVQVLRWRRRLPEPRWSFVAEGFTGAGWAGLLGAWGGEVGLAIAGGSAERLGQVLAVGASVGLALTLYRIKIRVAFPPLPGTSEGEDRFALVLVLSFLALAVGGLFLMSGDSVDTLTWAVTVAVAAVPAAGPLRLLGLVRSAVAPWPASAICARRVPPAVRWRLAALYAFAVLPFGGATVPLWRGPRRRLWEVAPAAEGDGAASNIETAMGSAG